MSLPGGMDIDPAAIATLGQVAAHAHAHGALHPGTGPAHPAPLQQPLAPAPPLAPSDAGASAGAGGGGMGEAVQAEERGAMVAAYGWGVLKERRGKFYGVTESKGAYQAQALVPGGRVKALYIGIFNSDLDAAR